MANICIFLLALGFSLNAYSEVYYFTEKDGENRTIFYKALCGGKGKQGQCSIKYISIGNKKSSRSCGVEVGELYPWGDAVKSGTTYTVSSTRGACGYTNTYIISEGGLTQVKTSPKKKKLSMCEVFEPKTYKMKAHKDVSTIALNVSGCESFNILALE